MIEVIFYFGSEVILVRVEGDNITFAPSTYGGVYTNIDGLKLDYNGVIKEHPDLKDNEYWKTISIQRFKNHIKSLKTEEEKMNYVVEDLKKFGYIPKFKQKKGFRREVIA